MKSRIFSSSPFIPDGIAIVRLFAGALIAHHGLPVFDPGQMSGMIEWMKNDFKLPMASFLTYFAKGLEFFGGILLALGLFTKIVSFLLVCVMGFIVFIIGKSSLFNDDQHPFLFFLLFVAFFFTGPGKWSLDYLLFDRKRYATETSR